MRVLVTGSAGHLGEALMRTLQAGPHDVVGLDRLKTPWTQAVGSIVNRDFVREEMAGVDAVLHTATLHKPHVETHSRQAFVDVNVTGTLNLLEEARSAGVGAFVFTSTTSTFGHALVPAEGEPAAWITEEVAPIPRNIYGVTKAAAEDLCQLFHQDHGLPCLVLRTSRFFPEEDDDPAAREAFADDNLKANEFLHRRLDLEDAVDAHLLAMECAPDMGFDRLILTATTPFAPEDRQALRTDAASVVRRYLPEFESEYTCRGWRMYSSIERVYVNDRARRRLDWRPKYDFTHVLACLREGRDFRSPLACSVGSKGYHVEPIVER